VLRDLLPLNLYIVSFQEFTFSVRENTPYRSIVGNVRATDVDSGKFGQIAYSLTGGKSEDFMIDQGTVSFSSLVVNC
jgi:hypothetical protein